MDSLPPFATWSDDKSYLAITTNPQIYGIFACLGRTTGREAGRRAALLKG
jgi:hypothetical protein